MRFMFGPDGPLRDAAPADGAEPGGAGAPGAGKTGAVDPANMQAEIERLKKENDGLNSRVTESEGAARYWHTAATKTPAKAAPAKTAEPEEDTTDLIELMSKGGTKALLAHLKKTGGLVDEETVAQRIESRATQIAAENQLATEYPDLKNTKTEFFKETAERYGPLVAQGVPQHIAMRVAAEQAELAGYKSGKRRTQDDKEEREARARAQGGGGEKKGAPSEESDDLDDFQARICEAMGVKPEDYKERAKKGVRMAQK